jgi:acetoin utilization deacetylase AcuC-like enzyme
LHAFYADHFVLPLPDGHRFPMEKYARLRHRMATELPAVVMGEAPSATDGELALAHSPAYISAVVCGELPSVAMREIGFPWSLEMVERSRRSAGATIAAARVALGLQEGTPGKPEGVAANMAGGTHHASADKGGGFCVFNDAAVAARLMQAEWARRHGRQRPALTVAIIDLDVHQGNGTANIFRDDASVFTLSMHGKNNFPFRKAVSDLDIDLPDRCNDRDYLQALQHALAVMDQRFQPGLVIYLAGADPFEGDRLGRLSLSFEGLEARERQVFDWAWQRRIPLAMAMAGGYGVNIDDTVQVQMNTYKVALAYWQQWQHATA